MKDKTGNVAVCFKPTRYVPLPYWSWFWVEGEVGTEKRPCKWSLCRAVSWNLLVGVSLVLVRIKESCAIYHNHKLDGNVVVAVQPVCRLLTLYVNKWLALLGGTLLEEISKACSHVWCVILSLLLGYLTSRLTVFGGRGNGNMENKIFAR